MRDEDWERAHLIGWEWCFRGRRRLGEGAHERVRGMEERDTDWERAHLRVGVVWGREMPTGREGT